ncbi:MAG TPA: right-handed parallel beta-helix repeat-containing protein [Pyrinomonadaceae bacterium]|jgi:hypothetical protein|nr:right-handed parallel beta-helix repeat-containing protein [Pyrinomonadaceae bacterium]
MNKVRLSLNVVAFFVFTLAISSLAQAQATRTWVSGVGDDVNPCSRTAPCKTFAGAISKTAANGEIDCLDPGGFGTLTATKSITVDGAGTMGSTLSALTTGFIVNDSATGTPGTIVVSLRNLSIQGVTTGTNGINFVSGKQLNVENCIIANINGAPGNGINVGLNQAISGNQRVFVKDTIIRGVAASAVRATNTAVGGGVNVVLENVTGRVGDRGIRAETGSRFTVINSSFSHYTTAGVENFNGGAVIDLDNIMLQGNGSGILAVSGTTRIANCRITNNTNGVNFTGGSVVSYGDNKIDGNGSDLLGGALGGATKR